MLSHWVSTKNRKELPNVLPKCNPCFPNIVYAVPRETIYRVQANQKLIEPALMIRVRQVATATITSFSTFVSLLAMPTTLTESER